MFIMYSHLVFLSRTWCWLETCILCMITSFIYHRWDEMTINFYVLCSLIKYRICCNMLSYLVVRKQILLLNYEVFLNQWVKIKWTKFSYNPTMWQLIRPFTCTFNHMIYLISHVICLNNTCGWFYRLPHNWTTN